MLLDVLSELARIEDLHGLRYRRPARDAISPATSTTCARCVPVYETLPGWQQDITAVRRLDDLPAGRPRYLDRLSELVGCPVESRFPWARIAKQTILAATVPDRTCVAGSRGNP